MNRTMSTGLQQPAERYSVWIEDAPDLVLTTEDFATAMERAGREAPNHGRAIVLDHTSDILKLRAACHADRSLSHKGSNMPDELNGNSASCLDRIVEVLANTQQDIQSNIRVLLTSQVLMTESIEKLTAQQKQTDQRLNQLAAQLTDHGLHTDERLNALINIVDGIVRGKKP